MPHPSTDIRPPSHWRRLPPSLRHFLLLIRADRPIGWWLLLLPGWVALPHSARLHPFPATTNPTPSSELLHTSPTPSSELLHTSPTPSSELLHTSPTITPPSELLHASSSPITPPSELALAMILFWLGAFLARSAGCVINDLWDRDLDRQTARTKLRPLASNQIPPSLAFSWLALLTALALVVLICLPPATRLVALAAVPLVIFYPLAKRFLPHPQLVLAPTFSWAALAGWAAFAGLPFAIPISIPIFSDGLEGFISVSPSQSWLAAACLYGGFAAWVFGYDTIYAIQDMADDKRLGVRSSALSLGGWLPVGVATAYSLALLGWGVAAVLMPGGVGFWLALGVVAWHLVWQVRQVQRLYGGGGSNGGGGKNPPPIAITLAGDVFRSNRNLGLILVAGSVGDYCLALAML